MVSPKMGNGTFNGSFLVLNVDNNTVGFGNSPTFQMSSAAIRPVTIESTPNPNAVDNVDVVSSSTDEGLATSESRKTKRVYEETDDPDWVPEKKTRKSSNSACRTIKTKPGPLTSSSNPSEISPEGGNGTAVGISGSPPQYLLNLLSLFGWRLAFRPGHGDYVYLNPSGLAYTSFPKAFETFLHNTSKYKEKACVSSVQRPPASGSNLGLQSGAAAADDCRKKGRGRRKRNSTVAEIIKPIKPVEEQIPPIVDPLLDNGKKSSKMQDKAVAQVANQVVLSCEVDEKTKSRAEDRCLGNEFKQKACCSSLAIENGQTCNGETFRDAKLLGVRRSARISGKHVPVESEVDITATNDNCLYLSACEDSEDKVKDKKQQTAATSRAEIVLYEMPGSCERDEHLNNEDRKSDGCNMGVIKNDRSNRSCMAKSRKSIGVRRSGRINNKKNDLVDVELDAEVGFENSCVAMTKSDCTAARKDEGERLILESVFDENVNCNINGETLSGEAKRFNCSNTTFSSQSNCSDTNGCGDTLGIRRSMRINGKHVPIDTESDTELWVDDDFFDPLEFAANRDVKKDKKKLTIPFLEVDNMDGGSPALDVMLLKQTNRNRSDCHKFKTHKQIESYNFQKNEKAKNPWLDKSSASVKESCAEIPVAEKCYPSSASKRKPSGCGNSYRKKNKKRKGGCGLTVRRKGKNEHQTKILSQTKISILSWLIDSKTLTENEKVMYITKNSMGNVSSGVVTRGGIWCYCCKEVVPFLKFVAHASGNLQQPWDDIFLLSGKTLLLCLKEAWGKEKKQRKVGFQTVGVDDPDPSDDTCGVCADGGQLICCDSCPSTFHQNCVMLKGLPEGSWYCPYCRCTFCMVAVHGSDRSLETLTLLTCKQCGCKYHQECAWGNDMHGIGSVPSLFCRKKCKKVAAQLSDMLGMTNSIEGGFSWTLLKRLDEDEGVSSNRRFSFIMECNVKLSMALFVLYECFVPLIDQRTGVDMISQAVYNCGSNFNRLNYEGFYTLILEKDEEILSVASLRLHGTSLVEMPFVGTRPMYRRQGMCHRLLKAVEDMLSSLQVEKLIIPAIPDLLETWMTSFSFKPLEPSHKDEIKNLNMMIFPETTLLQKSICSSTRAMGQEDVIQADDDVNHGKSIQKTHELRTYFGDQIHTGVHVAGGLDRWSDDCILKGQEDAAPEPCRMIEDSSFAPNSFGIQHPDNFNGSISESFPASSTTFMPNHNTCLTGTPFFCFPSTNVVLDDDPLGAGISNGHMNSWFQSADDLKDLQIDAISSTLSFENLLRIRS